MNMLRTLDGKALIDAMTFRQLVPSASSHNRQFLPHQMELARARYLVRTGMAFSHSVGMQHLRFIGFERSKKIRRYSGVARSLCLSRVPLLEPSCSSAPNSKWFGCAA
jgi:hypothetical protein